MTPEELEKDVMKQRCGTFDKDTCEKFKDDAILEQGKLPTLEQCPDFSEDGNVLEELQRLFSNEEIAEADD